MYRVVRKVRVVRVVRVVKMLRMLKVVNVIIVFSEVRVVPQFDDFHLLLSFFKHFGQYKELNESVYHNRAELKYYGAE